MVLTRPIVRRQIPVIPTTAMFFIIYLLSPHDYIFPAIKAANTSQQIIDDIIIANNLMYHLLGNQTLKDCNKSVITMIGELPEQEDEIDLTGIYSNFVHAYHYAFPAITWWPEAHDEFHQSRHIFNEARKMQKALLFMKGCRISLVDFYYYIHNYTHGAPVEEQFVYDANERAIRDLCIDNEEFPPHYLVKIVEVALTSSFETMALVLTSFWGAGKRKKIADQFDAPFDTSLFGRMHLDTTEADVEIHKRLTDTFPKYIDKVRLENPREADFLQNKLDEIRAKLKTPPFDKIYLDGDITALEERKTNANNFDGWEDFIDEMDYLYKEYSSIDQSSTLEENIEYWREDLLYFIDDLNSGKFKQYFDEVVDFYKKWLKVDPINMNSPNISAESRVLLEYGEVWDWDTDLSIQGMRAAWNLVLAVLEEIKCYMKDTYFYDLRDEALRRTQRDLNNGTLYYGTSYTIFLPCRITDDLDIVTPHCLAENNEICGPMGPLDDLQRPGSKLHGGYTMLRPKWVYKYDPDQKKCIGRKDYVAQIYHCRCGFRMDCGNDLGENITCQLQYNDLVRGQCRGGVGYPCKTLPLSPGKHHETCKSGYCNMKKNSCEDEPYHAEFVSRAKSIRLSLKQFQVAGLLVGISELRRLF